MKAAIIAFNNVKYSPYVKTYSNYLDENNISYDVILPNRDDIPEMLGEKTYAIKWDKNKHKALNFLKFRKEALRILKKNKYDFVFVLTTMPAVLLSGYLSRKYKGKYLVDIRDYTYENVSFYFKLEKRAVENSAVNVISSPGFKKFLPKADYLLCHNVNPLYRGSDIGTFEPSQNSPITIGYVGSIAYKSQCMKLINLVEKDERFRFHLYGDEGTNHQISDYLAEHPCDRIKAFGPYKPEDKVDIMKNVDILFNAYGYGRKLLDYALSNKLYDSFYMGIPLLTSPNTSMSEEAGNYSFDIDFECDKSLDELYKWYYNIDQDAFYNYSKEYLNRVFVSQDQFYEKLKNILL